MVDEPLGEGTGPKPARLMATALGHCLASSLRFCLERAQARAEVPATVDLEIRRNERGRWRIAHVDVQLDLSGVDSGQRAAVDRCLGLFEGFCIVTAGVRQGVPVDVRVRMDGERVSPSDPGERPV